MILVNDGGANVPDFTRKRGRDRFDNKGCEKTTETLRINSFLKQERLKFVSNPIYR